MKKLWGKVAIVTGASKGIGAGIAKALAAEGASVVVNYASSKEAADKVVAEIVAKDGKAVAIHGDVSKAADVEKLFAESKKAFGALHVLVNNAGVFRFASLEETTEEEFHRQFNINVLGTLLSAREALKYFDDKGGNIINVSSVITDGPMEGSAIYAATKGAVDTLTHGLAIELAPKKIRVNAIAPGFTETEGTHEVGLVGSESEKQMVSQTPLGRVGRAEDIARVAVFLASDDSAWLTGERIRASGGLR